MKNNVSFPRQFGFRATIRFSLKRLDTNNSTQLYIRTCSYRAIIFFLFDLSNSSLARLLQLLIRSRIFFNNKFEIPRNEKIEKLRKSRHKDGVVIFYQLRTERPRCRHLYKQTCRTVFQTPLFQRVSSSY